MNYYQHLCTRQPLDFRGVPYSLRGSLRRLEEDPDDKVYRIDAGRAISRHPAVIRPAPGPRWLWWPAILAHQARDPLFRPEMAHLDTGVFRAVRVAGREGVLFVDAHVTLCEELFAVGAPPLIAVVMLSALRPGILWLDIRGLGYGARARTTFTPSACDGDGRVGQLLVEVIAP